MLISIICKNIYFILIYGILIITSSTVSSVLPHINTVAEYEWVEVEGKVAWAVQ